ncbi:MAG: Holliday junction resolvase RuvX [Hyphomicrobiaceae bacterium]|nr:Holliday junction resolvase RuvX [Hyphomicrobiaceae bacterium]
MGLDLGTKTIGVSLSDLNWLIATPLETIMRKKFTIDAVRLLKIIDKHEVKGLVIGLPRHMNGSEGPRAQSTRAFVRNLQGRLSIPILLWDERLTTIAAERVLLDAKLSRTKRAKVIDKVAAAIILQCVLDACN